MNTLIFNLKLMIESVLIVSIAIGASFIAAQDGGGVAIHQSPR